MKPIKLTCHLLWDKHTHAAENSCLSRRNHKDRVPPFLIWLKTSWREGTCNQSPLELWLLAHLADCWREREGAGSARGTVLCMTGLYSGGAYVGKSPYKLIIQSSCKEFPGLSVTFHPPGRKRVSRGMHGLFPSKARSPQSTQRIRATIQIIQDTRIHPGLN